MLALLFWLPPPEAAAAENGRIAGTARRAVGGAPIASGLVQIFDSRLVGRANAQVVNGAFASIELPPGIYYAMMPNTPAELSQVYGQPSYCVSSPTVNRCRPNEGTPITVVAGQETSIAFSLTAGAFISGEVRGPDGAFAEDLRLEIRAGGDRLWWGTFPTPGPYRVGPLPPRAYRVSAAGNGLAEQIYPDTLCRAACVFTPGGEELVVAAGQERQNVNFQLRRTGRITGRVESHSAGAPLAGAWVGFTDAESGRSSGRAVETGADGSYRADLAPGSYLVTAASLHHQSVAWEDVPYFQRDLEAALLLATPVAVPEGIEVELGVMRLRPLARIAGRVVDATSGEGIADARLLVYHANLQPAATVAYSGADGSFVAEGLEPGTYYLLVDGPGARDLLVGSADVCFPLALNDYVTLAGCDPTRGTPFTVGFGQEAPAGQIALPAEGRLRGTIRLAEGRRGRPEVSVTTAGGGNVATFVAPSSTNRWSFDVPVPAGGPYFLVASERDHLVQVYDHLDCATGFEAYCSDFSAGTPVTVAAGGQRDALDFDLGLDRRPCRPTQYDLCLAGGRFTVRNYHEDPYSRLPTPSFTAPITGEAGYFTFFDADNVEVVAKVLDACDDFGAFWVFAAGLTDVRTKLEVRDNWAAETRIFESGPGPFQPLIDTTSFLACGLEPADSAPGAAAPAAAAITATPVSLEGNACGSDPAESLCLGGRFKVEAEWTTAAGATGAAHPNPLTADTGFFYFFSPGNIELVVKVLDACRPDLGNHYWVFAAGLTDVAVTLRVTDTATGEEQLYLSPLGRLFQPVLDLGAFGSCS